MIEAELISKLGLYFPNFKNRWVKKRTAYLRADNTISSCSIWSDLIHYFGNQWQNLDAECKSGFFYSLELCFISETSEADEGVFDAESLQIIQTCFLENLIHSPLYHDVSEYFGENTFRFVEKWNVEHK